MNRFFIRNDKKYRLLRTIVQGVIGVIIANLDELVGTFTIDPFWKPFIVLIVMAILSPIMAAIGTYEMNKPEIPEGYYEGMGENEDGESE